MQALSNRQEVGHLPIFHKFFKLKQRSSFREWLICTLKLGNKLVNEGGSNTELIRISHNNRII